MFFSVIIPIHNVETYLKKCVDSVLSQDYLDIEIILIDDGSIDGSSEVCDQYKKLDNRIKVIHQENAGVSVARNTGLNYATGDYVLFMDGDDYWNGDNILKDLEQVIIKNDFPDLIFNNSYFCVMPRGEKLKKRYEFEPGLFNKVVGEEALLRFFTETYNFPWSVWRNVYKNKVIKENNLQFEKGITLGEDADWLFRFILKSKKNILIDMPYYCYRVNRSGSAMTFQSYKNLSTYLFIVNKWLYYAEYTTNIELAHAIRSKLCDNYMGYFKYIYSFNKEDRAKIISQIQDSEIIKYANSPRNIQLKNDIENKGYEKVLKNLYIKHVLRKKVKQLVVKLGFIDR